MRKILLAVLLLSSLSFGQLPITKAQQRDCSNAIKAYRHGMKKGHDPADDETLFSAMHQACGTPEDYAAAHQTSGPATAAQEEPGTRDNKTATQESQPTPDMSELVDQHTTLLNREIALGNRLTAHFQKAQTWEGIDAEHPEAVALREKITQEEKELVAAAVANLALRDKLDVTRVIKECPPDKVREYMRLLNEATTMAQELKTQQDRYHALGY